MFDEGDGCSGSDEAAAVLWGVVAIKADMQQRWDPCLKAILVMNKAEGFSCCAVLLIILACSRIVLGA